MPAETVALAHDAALEADAFSFRLTERAFAPHYHRAWVVGCILAGARRLLVQGREYRAGSGDIVLLRPGEVHACVPAGEVPFVWRGFHFPHGSTAAALLDDLSQKAPFQALVRAGGGILEELVAVHGLAGAPAPPLAKRQRLFSALARLARSGSAGSRQSPMPAEPALEALRSHLERHATDRLSLADMAAMTRMGKYRLVRAFARLTGATPYRYLESARVNRAKELLEAGLPPAEAALEAGFADQSHLARAFRARLGVTPGACRRPS